MSKGPATAVYDRDAAQTRVAGSAVLLGQSRLGERVLIAEGAVVRSAGLGVTIDTGSAILENSVVVGTADMPTSVGRRSTFGHRSLVTSATVGDLCEIGNSSILMPGGRIGDRVFLGEGTLVPSGMTLPSDVVAVGRPARIIRAVTPADLDRLRALRDGDLTIPPSTATVAEPTQEVGSMGQLYAYRGIVPTIADSAVVFDSAEVTGDVVIGERSIIGAGVKIIGDSHGPVRIGNDVQILENTVLHLLPDNELVIDDGTIIGPGAMIHGCHIGARSVVEPGAIVCDGSTVGTGCVVRAGAVVKQRARFGDGIAIDGFPASEVGPADARTPSWALQIDDLPRRPPNGDPR